MVFPQCSNLSGHGRHCDARSGRFQRLPQKDAEHHLRSESDLCDASGNSEISGICDVTSSLLWSLFILY